MRASLQVWTRYVNHLFGAAGRRPRRQYAIRRRIVLTVPAEILEDRSLLSAMGVAEVAGLAVADDTDHCDDAHGNSRTQFVEGQPFEVTWDPGIPESAEGAATVQVAAAAALNPLTSIPQLHSNPGAAATLYLDFNGHFDANWGGYANVTTPVFDQDNDLTTFSDSELATIRDIWTYVSEDYVPFKIDVTTVEPPSFANGVAMRIAIGGDGAWTGGSYGGIAYIGSFTNSIVNTAYVFPKNLGNGAAKYTGEASSHEGGHSFGLQHQSEYNSSGAKVQEYYAGPGDGRAPIMGVSYYATRGLWWYGTPSNSSTSYQDDMVILSNATNGFGYRTDDYPTTGGLTVTGRDVSASGLIEKTTDQDSFSFTTGGAGEINLAIDVPASVANLNARLELRNAQGTVLAASDPSSFGFRRTISYSAPAGNYVLVVASHGGYGDVGTYTVSGTIPIASSIAVPTNLYASPVGTSQIDLSWVDNANNEDGYVIDRSLTGGQTWTRLTAQALPPDATSYSDLTGTAGTTYVYRVSAYNANEVSSYSNQATATTIPAPPGTLTAIAVWSTMIDLVWEDVAGETGFEIDRSSDGGNVWTQIATTSAGVIRYQDRGLQAATLYQYRVRATNGTGDSLNTGTASVTTLVAPPTTLGSTDGAILVEPWNGIYHDLRIQPSDQKIVTAGTKYSIDASAPSDHRMIVARYTAQGVLDTSYGTGGLTAPAFGATLEYGYNLTLQSDGKAVLTGVANSTVGVARFTSTGAVDTSFGSGGWTSVDVDPDDFQARGLGVGVQSTGKIVVAGSSIILSDIDPAILARFTTAGALDSGKSGFGKAVQGKSPGYFQATFGGDTNVFNDLLIQPDDKVVVVGYSATGATGGILVARYTSSGVLDTSFNGTGSNSVIPTGSTYARGLSIARQADGKIVAVGNCTGLDGSPDLLVVRFNTNGSLDTTFGGGAGYVRFDRDGLTSQTSESGTEIAIQSDGKIVVVGNCSVPGIPSSILVVRLNANGTLDSGFGVGGSKIGSLPAQFGTQSLSATGVSVLSDGSIVVSGSGTWTSGGADTTGLSYIHPLLMRFSGTTSASPVAGGTAGAPSIESNSPLQGTAPSNGSGAPHHLARRNALGIGSFDPAVLSGADVDSVFAALAANFDLGESDADWLGANRLGSGRTNGRIKLAQRAT